MSSTWRGYRPAIHTTAFALEIGCVVTLAFFTLTSHDRGAGIAWLVMAGLYAISIASSPQREPWHRYLVTALMPVVGLVLLLR